jgi:hypothetical protein
MTEPIRSAASEPGVDEDGEPLVPMLSLMACNKCRRRRGAQFAATPTCQDEVRQGMCTIL